MRLKNIDIEIGKSKLALTPKQLLWALGILYMSIPIVGWLCLCLWINTHVVQEPGLLVHWLPDQMILISQAKLNPVVLLPPYTLCVLILGISFQLFRVASTFLKWLAGFSMLINLMAIPFASVIVYSVGAFFIMTISLTFTDFRIK